MLDSGYGCGLLCGSSMNSIGYLLVAYTPKIQSKKRTTERSSLYDTFLEHINPPRVASGYKPLTHARLGYLLKNVPTADLYALDSECRRADNYSKLWWWKLDPKNGKK